MESSGVIMGELQMTKIATGERTIFKIDGTIERDIVPIQIDWCDKCSTWKSMEFGRYEEANGLRILWFCQDCK
jgi:hypothetical protein